MFRIIALNLISNIMSLTNKKFRLVSTPKGYAIQKKCKVTKSCMFSSKKIKTWLYLDKDFTKGKYKSIDNDNSMLFIKVKYYKDKEIAKEILKKLKRGIVVIKN